MNLDKSKEIRRTRWALLILSLTVGSFIMFIYVGMPAWMHDRKNLQRDYEEVFATPFKDVQVSEYWNANTGRGVRFHIFLTSYSQLRLKDPATFEELPLDSYGAANGYNQGWFLKTHPWVATVLYHKQPVPGQEPGPISVYLNQSKNRCEVYASMASGIRPTKRNGKEFTVSRASHIELQQVDESYIAHSKTIDHCRIAIYYPNSDIAISTKSVDLRLDLKKLTVALLGYLRELEAYNGQDAWERIKEKLLNLEIPDGAISDEQVAILDKLAAEVKDYNSHLLPGAVPIRLRVTVAILGADSRGMLKNPHRTFTQPYKN